MSSEDHPEIADPTAVGAPAAYAALEQEIVAALGALGAPLEDAIAPVDVARMALEGVREALDEADAPKLGLALDSLEDVLESQLRAGGWPARAVGRGEAVP